MDLKKGWNISSSLSHRVTIAITVSAGKRSRLGLPWTVIKNTSRLPWLHTFDFNWNFVHRERELWQSLVLQLYFSAMQGRKKTENKNVQSSTAH